MRKFLAVPIVILAIGGSTACATKKFVRTSVGEVNDKVDSMGRSLEETQERQRRAEGRITEVDTKASAAAQAAQAAQNTANEAGSQASAAGTAASAAGTAATAAGSAANAAAMKADAVDKATKRLVYEVVLSEDEGNFKFAKVILPDEAKAKLDELVTSLKADPKGAYFEIEGHTDNVGDPQTNERIGLERAESVKRYLYEQHQVPLFKINVISYGEAKPIAPNKTRDGRAQNRRVVIKVLA
jgi:outer membrane protein OmpA-like peptidoglycan-associated protein